MSSRKRSRDAEPDMTVKTSHGEPLPAESCIVRACSSCAKQLPASTAEWDVSGFLYNGQPFTRETVKCWVSCAYSVLHGPAELDADDKEQLSTAKGLHAVLSFAHAVGSPVAVCTAACSQLGSLKIVAQLPEQAFELELSCSGGSCYFTPADGGSRQLYGEAEIPPIGQPVSQQQEQDVKQQVAEQTGALLQLAHVLRLQPLISALHDFICCNTKRVSSLLYGVLELVFSDAVLAAALGSGTVSKEAYVSSVLSRPCGFVGWPGYSNLLKPVSRMAANLDTGDISIDAQVVQDGFAGCRAGDRVQITLNLFSTDDAGMTVVQTSAASGVSRAHWFPAQLLLGRTVATDSDLQALMSSSLDAGAGAEP